MDAATMRARARIIDGIRAFFRDRGYLEVDTPLLSARLIPEPAIEVFPVRRRDHSGASQPDLYLVPSPELWMKRLLSAGSGAIFQVCHCFRNVEETSRLHSAEFTMLEWYTPGHTYLESADVTEALLQATGIRRPVCRRSMADLFREHTGLDLDVLEDEQDLRAAAEGIGVAVTATSDWEECFNKVFLTCVEPALAAMGSVFVLDYPCALRTLARRKGRTAYAERWELYVDGVELANCYTEENDPAVLTELFAHEGDRKAASLVPHPADREVAGLPLPPCSGVALGLDRLVMLALGASALEEVIFFPRFGIL